MRNEKVVIHPHARERMAERGANEDEITATVKTGEMFTAKYGRTGFRRTFPFAGVWRGKTYAEKQVEVFAVNEGKVWIVVTVIVKWF